jgi:hypothetical protein
MCHLGSGHPEHKTARTRVVHCLKSAFDIYIGRRWGEFKEDSIWHNPFHLGKDGSRAEVIAKYRAYILGRPDLLALLPTLKGKVLGCWCHPQECHGDVLVELIEGAPEAPAQAALF